MSMYSLNQFVRMPALKYRRIITALFVIAATFSTATYAQSNQQNNQTSVSIAEQAKEKAHNAMQEALDTYVNHYPDAPLWQEAIRYAQQAANAAPDDPETLELLAEVYSRANWYIRAWDSWQTYLNDGNELSSDVVSLFVQTGNELGYSAYKQGNYEQALSYYKQVIDYVPYDKEAYVWVARILTETNQPEAAIPYWETVVQRDNTDNRAAYFLELSKDQATWGIEATNAFRKGVAYYEQQNLAQAALSFEQATTSNSAYATAWAWRGRVAFDQENYGDAATFYKKASNLEPGNSTYSYFYTEARRLQMYQASNSNSDT